MAPFLTAADIASCQADQLDSMWDTCIIRDPDTWVDEQLTEGAVAWTYLGQQEIPCRVAIDDTQPHGVVVGEQDLTVVRLIITMPTTVCPTTNQVVTIVSTVIDPHMAGHRFDVAYSDFATYLTARRVHCIDHR